MTQKSTKIGMHLQYDSVYSLYIQMIKAKTYSVFLATKAKTRLYHHLSV